MDVLFVALEIEKFQLALEENLALAILVLLLMHFPAPSLHCYSKQELLLQQIAFC